MKRVVVIITLLLVVTLSCNRSNYSNLQKNEHVVEAVQEAVAEDIKADSVEVVAEPHEYHLSILIAGDFMQHGPQIQAASRPDSTYNYDECFARVKPVIEKADVAIGNFEVTLGGKPYAGYPRFSAPDEYLQAIIDAGIDIILTANNHCLDTGKHGLERTIHVLDSIGVPRMGTYLDEEDRDYYYPYLLELNGRIW